MDYGDLAQQIQKRFTDKATARAYFRLLAANVQKNCFKIIMEKNDKRNTE
jgi:hypothetical protein